MRGLSRRRVAVLVAIVAAVLAVVGGIATWAALSARAADTGPAADPLPVPTFVQDVPDAGLPPLVTEPPGPGVDASGFGDAAAVPGAFQVGDYWFVDCGSEHAINPPRFPEHGCEIAGFEQELGSLIAPDELTQQQPASADDQATAAALVTAWVPLDSTASQTARDGQLEQLAPGADLPRIPELGWQTNQLALGDLGYRALVELRGTPTVTSSVARPDGSAAVTVEADYLATYSMPIDCPWGEAGADDEHCALGFYQGPSLWTVHLQDGAVTAIFEPEIIRD